MAHDITTDAAGKDSMAFIGEVPWHGLGQSLSADADLATWQTEAGLDWSVIQSPVYFDSPTKFTRDGEGAKVYDRESYRGRVCLVRSDTGVPLSVVTNRYNPVQPSEVMSFFRDFVEGVGGFKMETAGALRGGKKIWALAKDTSGVLALDETDKIERYLLLATSYDMTIKTVVQQTSVRVVCANTLASAYFRGEKSDAQRGHEVRLTVSHLGKFNGDKVKERMMLDQQWKGFGENIRRLADKKIAEGDSMALIGRIFFPKAKREAVGFSEKAASKKIEEIAGYLGTQPGAALGTSAGTAWGVVNAVTYFVDHVQRSRTDDIRLDKSWFGEGNALKNRAFDLAMATTA